MLKQSCVKEKWKSYKNKKKNMRELLYNLGGEQLSNFDLKSTCNKKRLIYSVQTKQCIMHKTNPFMEKTP